MPQVMLLRVTDHGGYDQDDNFWQTLSQETDWQDISQEDADFLKKYWHKRVNNCAYNIFVEKIDHSQTGIVIADLRVKLEEQIKRDEKMLADQKKAAARRLVEKEAKIKEKRQKTINLLMKKYDINEVAAEQMIKDLKIKV